MSRGPTRLSIIMRSHIGASDSSRDTGIPTRVLEVDQYDDERDVVRGINIYYQSNLSRIEPQHV
jgi:hypothetical protein